MLQQWRLKHVQGLHPQGLDVTVERVEKRWSFLNPREDSSHF